MVSEDSGRRRFIRRVAEVGAAGGVAALLSGRVPERQLIPPAEAADVYVTVDQTKIGTGTTEVDSDVVGTYVPVFLGHASATSGLCYGVMGQSDSTYGRGVFGYATAQSGQAVGLHGRSNSEDGIGVAGDALAASGHTTGLWGRVDSPDGNAVWAYAAATTGYATAVYAQSDSPTGTGVGGFANAVTGVTGAVRPTGVRGVAIAPGGDPANPESPTPTGVEGYASGASGFTQGVFGHSDSPIGIGVAGYAAATSGFNNGVLGISSSLNGTGVRGLGGEAGVYGEVSSPDGAGVWGHAAATTADLSLSPKGVLGLVDTNGGSWGEGPWPRGVEGHAAGSSGVASGVYGQADSPDADGVTGIAWAPSGLTCGVYGESESTAGTGVGGRANGDGGIGVLGRAGGAGAIPIVARAASGQTAPLQEWVNDNLTPLAVVDKDGNFGIGTATPVRQVHIRGSNAVARLDRNVDSASFIFVRTSTDFSQVWKSFTFGVKATGVDTGSFFIGDMHTNVSGSSDNRILIDTSGNVGIGTTAPSSKLHVAGRVKALGYDTGDITYANGMKTTEEGSGLAFLNDAGEMIAVLDREGNFHIKGDIIKDL